MGTVDGGLHVETDAPARVPLGDPVRVTLRATNTGTIPTELSLLGRSVTFDILVSTADGAPVWRRLEGEIVPMILQLRTLAPGETLTVEGEWDQRRSDGRRVEPGRYVVEGAMLTDGAPVRTPPSPLEIVPRSR